MNTYLIVSETNYNIDNKLNELKKDIDNIIVFNMDENSMDEILEEASYFSMFDDKKCIIVKNAKLFGSSKSADSTKSKTDSEKLIKYLANENRNTRLIFTFSGKVDSKKKIYNILKENGNTFEYKNLTKTDMKNELAYVFNKEGYKIDDSSLWYIINNTLGNFDLAVNEAKKIMIYYSKPVKINYTDVVMLTAKSIEENNFKLIDSIISRNLETSLKCLQESKILKIEPTMILSLIYREFKLMYLIYLYEKNGYDHKEILSNLGIADWQYNKIKNNLRTYNIREVKEEIIKLSELDFKLKSGLINKDVVLSSYIIDLCS